MVILFRNEFRRIDWLVLHVNLRMLLQEHFHAFSSMGARAIPDQYEMAADMTHQVFHHDQQNFDIDRVLKCRL